MKKKPKFTFLALSPVVLAVLGIVIFQNPSSELQVAVFAQDSPSKTTGNGGAAVNSGESAIHKAARAGNLALLHSQLQSGADANVRDDAGRTPLMDAVAAGQIEAVRLLLSAGADVNARTHAGRTPLIEAAAQGQLEAARLLVKAGADLNYAQRGWGSALKTAERTGHNDIAALLLKAGARSTGSSVGDTVCVRPWGGDGYCGTVEAINKTRYRIRVTKIVGCSDGCPAKAECSAGRPVGGAEGVTTGDEVNTVSWCLTHTGVKP
jgi:ankyrin repeat protein